MFARWRLAHPLAQKDSTDLVRNVRSSKKHRFTPTSSAVFRLFSVFVPSGRSDPCPSRTPCKRLVIVHVEVFMVIHLGHIDVRDVFLDLDGVSHVTISLSRSQ